jgi:hypothetical protein
MTFIKTAARLVLLASCGASTPSYSHSYVTRLRHRNVITQYIVFTVHAGLLVVQHGQGSEAHDHIPRKLQLQLPVLDLVCGRCVWV